MRITTASFTVPLVLSALMLSSSPSRASSANEDEEIKKMKTTLAAEQNKTQEIQNLQSQIDQEKQKQQQLSSGQTQEQPDDQKLHGLEKRAHKVKKWASKHKI